MKKYKILAIAPYKGMAEIIQNISKEDDELELTVKIGDLEEGLNIVRSLSQANDYDLILSRGGTAELIRENLPILVSEVPFSVYDLLRCIKMAETYTGKAAIVGFRGITSNARILCDLLQIKMEIVTLKSKEEALPKLQDLKSHNYSLVICDMISHQTARKIGLNSIFVSSGIESIRDAITTAKQLIDETNHLRIYSSIFENIIVSAKEYICIFDSKNRLWFSSHKNASGIDPDLREEFRTTINTYISDSDKIFVKQFKNYIYDIECRHFSIDQENFTLIRISRKRLLFDENDRSISIYTSLEDSSPDFFTETGSSNYVGGTRDLLNKYAPQTMPILITGEEGTGKEKAAFILYSNGPYKDRHYYVIDCALLIERKWSSLINNDSSPFNEVHVTIHLKNMQAISKTEFAGFTEYLRASNLTKRNRMIYTIVSNVNAETDIKSYLLNKESCLHIALLPLKNRVEDLSSIAMLYINQYNLILGKQIIAFETDALKLIRSYDWPGNFEQFKRVIKELLILTESSYITADSVKRILQQEQLIYNTASPTIPNDYVQYDIDFTKTLGEIEQEIVRKILLEENMNRENTAKRLGISRTTLWRMLK